MRICTRCHNIFTSNQATGVLQQCAARGWRNALTVCIRPFGLLA